MHIFHKWKLIKSEGKYNYYECKKCKARKYEEISHGGYQPLDYKWLTFHDYVQNCSNCNKLLPPKTIINRRSNIFHFTDYVRVYDCDCGSWTIY
jgi:NAD-dependent SIR2 family protein deacetylase